MVDGQVDKIIKVDINNASRGEVLDTILIHAHITHVRMTYMTNRLREGKNKNFTI
jgi:hypothetical protein